MKFGILIVLFLINVAVRATIKDKTNREHKIQNTNMSSRPQSTNTRGYTGRQSIGILEAEEKSSQILSRTGRSMTSRGKRSTSVIRYEPKSGKAVANVEGVGKFLSKKNSGFDEYPAKNTSNKEFGKVNLKKADSMTYSHIYEGHEPWDDCLPKEKDPWEKGFFDRFREE